MTDTTPEPQVVELARVLFDTWWADHNAESGKPPFTWDQSEEHPEWYSRAQHLLNSVWLASVKADTAKTATIPYLDLIARLRSSDKQSHTDSERIQNVDEFLADYDRLQA